jgi:PAS domain-containing protein
LRTMKETRRPIKTKDDGRLYGWAEIASFLGRGIRTVQRWEKDVALPIHRLFKQPGSPVHAYRKELVHWVKAREEHPFILSYITSESHPGGNPNLNATRDVLAGWKEVAAFLGRSVRTVQLWEKKMGLPVRRLKSKVHSIPYALRGELADWLKEFGMLECADGKDAPALHPPRLLQNIIDGLTAGTAVLSDNGTIIAVNQAWKEAARAQGWRAPDFGLGIKYLDLCESPYGALLGMNAVAAENVTELLKGARRGLQIKYRSGPPTEKRWFLHQSSRFDFQGAAFLLLIHSDVTGLLGD